MIKLFWEKLLTTIWFVPTIISTAFVISAICLLYFDQHVDVQKWAWTHVFQIGVDGTSGKYSPSLPALLYL